MRFAAAWFLVTLPAFAIALAVQGWSDQRTVLLAVAIGFVMAVIDKRFPHRSG